MRLSDVSIHAWIQENKIKNEKGELLDFRNHLFSYDILKDQSENLTVMKGAQIGMSTNEVIKNHFDAKRFKLDIIYTLPTDTDVNIFVNGKVNRIIANNPCMIKDVADQDSIEQKQVGASMIYFRGTWTKKAATMVSADRLSHDEKDSSKLDVVADYQSRLQHSKIHQTHTFSHPSLPETGVHADWLQSDQKHWFVKCPHCNTWQFMSWNEKNPQKMSVDFVKRAYVCKKCRGILDDRARATGQWVAKFPEKKWSGYWVSLLIAPWYSAGRLIDDFNNPDTSKEQFWNKKLGLPYANGTSKLLRKHFMKNLTGKAWAPPTDERVILGIDTGLRLDFVLGGKQGLFHHGDTDDYGELDEIMIRWPKCIAIIDQGGDLIGSRKFYERWPGRVFLCSLAGDRKTKELVKWAEGDEHGAVTADRNRMIQLTVDEFRDGRIPVHGTEDDWYEYWLDWKNLSKIKVLDPQTNQTKGYKWVRSGRDHRALATVFWRVGMSRFIGQGLVVHPETKIIQQKSYMINANQTVTLNTDEFFDLMEEEKEDDWRL